MTSVFQFSTNTVFFEKKKGGKVATLRQSCSVFPSKTPIFGHISDASFDRKCIKIIDILIFIIENQTVFVVFLLDHPIFEKTELKMSICDNFRIKSDEKVAREKTYRLKLEFYNTHGKMKNIIRSIFISIIMHPSFIHFH